jgi:hypothetical protein
MTRPALGLLALAVCGTAAAQPPPPPPGLPSPRVQFVFPPGAKAGPAETARALGFTFGGDARVAVTGTDLDEPEKLAFSHPGITGTFVAPKLPEPDPKKKDAPPPKANTAGPHTFTVAVAADVPPGTYDVRFVGKFGVSNPRAFVVGTRDEVAEREPNNDVPEAQRVAVGTTVNGVLATSIDVDYAVFAGKKGQRVVVSCLTTSIDSRAAPMIEVFDAAGRKLAVNRNYRDADAVADVTLPADGDYHVRLFPVAYLVGGPDYVYRLTISAAPWIDAVFPPAVEPGKPTPVTLYGRNLPGGQPADGFTVDGFPLEKLSVTVTPPADAAAATRLALRHRADPVTGLQDGFEYTLKGPGGVSNPVPIYFARAKPVVKKNAGGTTAAAPEDIPAPCEVAGFLSRRGDADWYRFAAKKGEVFVVELTAERGGTPADFFASVRDGKDPKRDLSGDLDDDPDSLHPSGFYSRSADPAPYRFTAPEDGQYLVLVGCRDTNAAGPRTAYRLRVAPPRPDFRAVAMPYSRHFQTGANVWQGGTLAYDVYVSRIDGFAGPVAVTAEGLPAGVTAKPLTVGAGARWGVLVLTATDGAAPAVGPFTLTATGTGPDGKPLAREVRPASVTWGLQTQQNPGPVVARLDHGFVLAVRGEKAIFTLAADPAGAVVKVNMKDEKVQGPLVVKQGDKFTVPVKVAWAVGDKQAVLLTAEPLAQNPQNSPVTVQVPTQPTKDKPEGVVSFDVKASAAPGPYAVTVKGVAQVPYARPAGAGAMAKGGNVPAEAFADPVAFLVVPSSVAKPTVAGPPNNTAKPGATAELTVKVERQHDFAGEFKVTFAPPAGVTGVSADEVTIPAGKDEAKLVVKVDDDAKPGPVTNATVTLTAKYAGKHPVTHEAKVTFTVAK